MVALPAGRDHTLTNANEGAGARLGSLIRLRGVDATQALSEPRLEKRTVLLAYVSSSAGEELPEFAPHYKILQSSDGADYPALPEISELLGRPDIALRPELAFLRSRLAAIVAVSLIVDQFEHTINEGEMQLGGVFDPVVARATVKVRSNPADRWTLDLLSQAAGCSRSTLVSRFRNVMGVSPLAFVTSYRLDLAAKLLRQRDLPLARVAEKVGFASESSFSKVFKRRHGRSPSPFRSNTED